MEDPRIISALFIFLKMAYYNVLINNDGYLETNPLLDMKKYYWDVPAMVVYSKKQIRTLLQAA